MKFDLRTAAKDGLSRSREGAWIEISASYSKSAKSKVAPARERGLKLLMLNLLIVGILVAPARERGLKLLKSKPLSSVKMSLPRGSVD